MLSFARRMIAGAMLATAVLGSALRAWGAGEPNVTPQSGPVDLRLLGAELDLYSAEAHRKRLAAALTGVGVGGVLVPAGLVLLGRTDGVSRALVVGMIVGGSAQIISVPFGFIPTRMDEIRDEFMNKPERLHSEAWVHALEHEWRLAAEASRSKRTYVGATMLTLGALSLAAGMTFLLAPEGIFGMSRQTQYTWGGITMGSGVPVLTLGVRFLIEWSTEETSWDAYRTMKFDAKNLGRIAPPSIGVAPTAGGAMAFATMQF